jgi:hypothetical protein
MESIESIRRLLEKYFDGQTSLREESTLQRYFRRKNIPAEWEVYRPMFQYFTTQRKAFRRPAHPLLRAWIPVSSAAAVFLMFAIKLALPTPDRLLTASHVYINGKSFTDIELVQNETLKALEQLSEQDPDVYASQVEALNLFCNNN